MRRSRARQLPSRRTETSSEKGARSPTTEAGLTLCSGDRPTEKSTVSGQVRQKTTVESDQSAGVCAATEPHGGRGTSSENLELLSSATAEQPASESVVAPSSPLQNTSQSAAQISGMGRSASSDQQALRPVHETSSQRPSADAGPRQVRKRVVRRTQGQVAMSLMPASETTAPALVEKSGLDLNAIDAEEQQEHPHSDAGLDPHSIPASVADDQHSWDVTAGRTIASEHSSGRLSPPEMRSSVVSPRPVESAPINSSITSERRAPVVSSYLKRCPNCGSEELEFMSSSGQTTCIVCGHVIEENAVVNELQFTEGIGGHSAIVGQFVRTGSTGTGVPGASTAATSAMLYGASTVGVARLTIGHRESRELTYAAGRRRIATIASQLHLPPRFVDAAHRLFTLAVQHNFVQGRRTQNVAAAALYIVCRREKTPHLLIDFSDTLRINVYVLGHTYLKLCRVLHLSLPIIDPSFYIHRFASRLEFGEKQNLVAQTALRLISRMKRDWIHTGRRPAGLCGAALLIAARMHGFRRSQREISAVVRVGDMTIRQRLCEIEETPTATLTGRDLADELTTAEHPIVDSSGGVAAPARETFSETLSVEQPVIFDGCDPPAFRKRHPLPLEWIEQQQRILERYEVSEMNAVVDNSLTEQERAFLEASAVAEGQRVPVTVLVAPAAPNGSISNYIGSFCRSEPVRPASDREGIMEAEEVAQSAPHAHPKRIRTDTKTAPAPEMNRTWASERVEELSDLNSDEEAMFVCTPEETAFREKIWTAMNQEWIEREAEIARWERDDPERYQRLMRKREYMRGFYKSTSATAEANWSTPSTALASGTTHIALSGGPVGSVTAPTGAAHATTPATAIGPVVRSVRDAVRSAVTHSKRTSKKINYEALERYDAARVADRHLASEITSALTNEVPDPNYAEPSLFDFGDAAPQTQLPEASSTRPRQARRRVSHRRATRSANQVSAAT
jgi:transcription initiation factor TFIIIB Brf1 subunit/transcription initiation factor TFIIB